MPIILHRSCNGLPFKHMCTQLLYGTIHPSIFSILNGPYKQFRWLTDWLGFWLLPAVVGHCHPYEYACMGRVLYYMCVCESSCEWVCDCVCVARSQCTLGEFVDFLLWLFVQSFIRSVFLLFFFFLLLLRLRLRLLSHLLFGVCTHTMFILSTGKTELMQRHGIDKRSVLPSRNQQTQNYQKRKKKKKRKTARRQQQIN